MNKSQACTIVIIKTKMKSMLMIMAYYPPKLFHNMQLEISEFSQIESWKISRHLQFKKLLNRHKIL
jgi:hypothetical protein